MALFVFGTESASEPAYLNVILNKADGSGQKTICGAHAQGVRFKSASCSTLLELGVGDQLWPVGDTDGALHTDGNPNSSFQAYLLYRDDTLQ